MDYYRRENAGYLISDEGLDINRIIGKSLIIYGERHGCIDDEKVVGKLIKDWRADLVLSEALGDLVLMDLAAKNAASRRPIDDFYYGNFTRHWITLSKRYNIPFIGMEKTQWEKDYSLHTLAESFELRENHFIQMIEKYRQGKRVIAICGDTHVRTIKTKELGQVSPLFTKYSKDNDAVVIRSKIGEIW